MSVAIKAPCPTCGDVEFGPEVVRLRPCRRPAPVLLRLPLPRRAPTTSTGRRPSKSCTCSRRAASSPSSGRSPTSCSTARTPARRSASTTSSTCTPPSRPTTRGRRPATAPSLPPPSPALGDRAAHRRVPSPVREGGRHARIRLEVAADGSTGRPLTRTARRRSHVHHPRQEPRMTTTRPRLPHPRPGSYELRQQGVCLMEAVAWYAGENHSDMPACVSPVLRRYGMSLNDRLPAERRQELKAFIPRLVGTAGDGGRRPAADGAPDADDGVAAGVAAPREARGPGGAGRAGSGPERDGWAGRWADRDLTWKARAAAGAAEGEGRGGDTEEVGREAAVADAVAVAVADAAADAAADAVARYR